MPTKATLALSIFSLCLIPAFAVGQLYTVTDLGPLAPTAINTLGQVVGNYNGHAYMWTKTRGMQDLGILPGGTFSKASAINDFGVVAGTADGPGTVFSTILGEPNQTCSGGLIQPFVWTAKQGIEGLGTTFVQGLQLLPSWCSGQFYGTGINANGQVVGFTQQFPAEYQWGFSWLPTAGMTSFGGSWPPTYAEGVSNTGQIVGQNSTTYAIGHATSWKNGIATDLNPTGTGPLGGEYNSSANAVNDLGQIVGWSTTNPVYGGDCYDFLSVDSQGCPVHAVLWTASGAMTDLGTLSGDTLSIASKINLFGLVIGSSGNIADLQEGVLFRGPLEVTGRPFIWSGRSGMRDLNTMIRGRSGWVLNTATDINLWGQIVGQGALNGQPHGYLLTPRAFFKF